MLTDANNYFFNVNKSVFESTNQIKFEIINFAQLKICNMLY